MDQATPHMVSISISCGVSNTSCQATALHNPNEMEIITTITVPVNAPVQTTVTGGVVVVAAVTYNTMKYHCNR